MGPWGIKTTTFLSFPLWSHDIVQHPHMPESQRTRRLHGLVCADQLPIFYRKQMERNRVDLKAQMKEIRPTCC